ncbi:MAG: PepSY domain-containing protein [Kordiimonadaceae bacterium]|nr:PepSY domain-containing protein [Kordiimonadaceae bacterium]
MNQTFRQSMAWLHTWAGLTVSWVLFFIFVMGTISYFDYELNHWMEPERATSYQSLTQGEMLDRGLARLQSKNNTIDNWTIHLPVARERSFLISWDTRKTTDGSIPANKNYIEHIEALVEDNSSTSPSFNWVTPRATEGGDGLFVMHYSLHYLPTDLAWKIVVACTMFMFVSIITGVIVHKKIFKDFFTFRPQKGQRSWLDMHTILAVIALPFHLIVTYSGLLFMLTSAFGIIVFGTYGNDTGKFRESLTKVSPTNRIVREKANISAPTAPLSPMLEIAAQRWGKDQARFIRIYSPGDQNSTIEFRRIRTEFVDDNSYENILMFDGPSGALLTTTPEPLYSTVNTVTRTMFSIHVGLFSGPVIRWLYFLTGILGTAMVATGMLLWASKRRQKQERADKGVKLSLRAIEKANAATIVGLPTGIVAYLWANRLLPVNLPERAALETNVLFITWLAMALYALARPIDKVWKELLVFGANVAALLPLVNVLTSNRHLGNTLPAGEWHLAGVDLTVLVFSAFMFFGAYIIHKRSVAAPKAARKPRRASAALVSDTAKPTLEAAE